MTSSINPNNIDGTYPIAGQDNDSQGFRDNFTNIKNNLTFAKSELEDLQSKVVLKSALAGATLDNSMNYSQLIEPLLTRAVETKNNLGTPTSSSLPIDWGDGHFQYFTADKNVAISFSGWPDNNQYAKMRLEITTDSSARTITFPSAVSFGLDNILGSSGQNVVLPANGTYLFELTTYDSATNITIRDLTRNYDSGELNFSGVILNNGYQWANSNASYGNLVSGNTFTVSSSVNRVILQPTSTFDSLYVKLPANVNAKTIRISSTADITNVSISGSGGTSVAPSGNITLTAGQGVEYIYLSSTATWYKS